MLTHFLFDLCLQGGQSGLSLAPRDIPHEVPKAWPAEETCPHLGSEHPGSRTPLRVPEPPAQPPAIGEHE